MAETYKLTAEFESDVSGLLKGIDQAQSAVKGIEKTLSNALGGLDKELSGLGAIAKTTGDSLSGSFSEGVSSISDVEGGVKGLKSELGDLGKVDIGTEGIDKLSKGVEDTTEGVEGLDKAIDGVDTKGIGTEGLDKLKKEVVNTKEEVEDLDKAIEDIDTGKVDVSGLEKLQMKFQGIAEDFSTFGEDIKTKTGEIGDKFQELGKQVTKVGDMFTKAGNKMTLGVTLPLLALGKKSVDKGLEFGTQMNMVYAISGADEIEQEMLRQQALDLGASSVFGAIDVAKGQEQFASSGFNIEEIRVSMPGIIDLGAISGEGGIELASGTVGVAIRNFGLDPKDSSKVADILAKVSADTTAEVEDLSYALSYVAPDAGALGLTLEETAGAIGMFSDQGIKGSRAGTAFRSILNSLKNPGKGASEVMEAIGFNAFNSSGKLKPLNTILEELENSLKGMSDQERQSTLNKLFGDVGGTGINSLLMSTPGTLAEITRELERSEGAASRMADILMQGFPGVVEELEGEWETALINISDSLERVLVPILGIIQEILEAFNALPEEQRDKIVDFFIKLALIGPALWIVGSSIKFIGTTLSALGIIIQTTGILIGFFTSQAGLVVLAILAIVAVIYVVAQFWDELVLLFKWGALVIETYIARMAVFLKDVFFGIGEFWIKTIFIATDAIIGRLIFLMKIFGKIFEGIGLIVSTVMNAIIDKVVGVAGFFGIDIEVEGEQAKEKVQNAMDGVFGVISRTAEDVEGRYEQSKEATWKIFNDTKERTEETLDIWHESMVNRHGELQAETEEYRRREQEKTFEHGAGMVQSYADGLYSVQDVPKEVMGTIVNGAVEETGTRTSEVLENGRRVGSSYGTGIKNTEGMTRSQSRALRDASLEETRRDAHEFVEAGKVSGGNYVTGIGNEEGNVRSQTSRLVNTAITEVNSRGDSFYSGGRGIGNSVARGIESNQGSVMGAMGRVLQRVRDMIPSSPPKDKTSPLADLHKNGIGTQLAEGILAGEGVVRSAMGSILDFSEDGYILPDLGMEVAKFEEQLRTLVSGNIDNSLDMRYEVEDISEPIEVIVHNNFEINGRQYDNLVNDVMERADRMRRKSRI